MARSVAIIGAGQIGYAAAGAFANRGWDVTIYARSKPKWFRRGLHRFSAYRVGECTPPSADVVFDTIAFDDMDVARYDPSDVGRLIAISSASVYCDDAGRTLDEAQTNGWPDFGGAVTEDQATVPPGPATYSTRKVRMEDKARELFGDRATVFRPCAIYGAHSRHPREWWFIKRYLDGRPRIPLMDGGASRFQTTDADDIGYAGVLAAERALGGIFNIADEDSPSVLEIGVALSHSFQPLPEFVSAPGDGTVGRTPWSVGKPFMVSAKKLVKAGFEDQINYGAGVLPASGWLRELNPKDWRAAFPVLAGYPYDHFDYAAEDEFFEHRLNS